MRVLLAELAPRLGELSANLERLAAVVEAADADLCVFPELFLSGYRTGDRVVRTAVRVGDPTWAALASLAERTQRSIAVGAPLASADRPGEVHNAVLLATPGRPVVRQIKRFLPTYGPFEEGTLFTPTDRSEVHPLGPHVVGLQICYDAFFPEVSRELALGGAELLLVVSAAPVTSQPLFAKVLPARAVENAAAVVYVNRVGVEDGLVFGGGSGAWDPRGEPRAADAVPLPDGTPEERLLRVELDLTEVARWRRFRPTLRDVAGRGRAPPSAAAGRTDPL